MIVLRRVTAADVPLLSVPVTARRRCFGVRRITVIVASSCAGRVVAFTGPGAMAAVPVRAMSDRMHEDEQDRHDEPEPVLPDPVHEDSPLKGTGSSHGDLKPP